MCFRLFATKCSKCGAALLPSDFILRCFQKVFHAHCFQCIYCTRTLKKGDQYVLVDGQIVCQQDYATTILSNNPPSHQQHFISPPHDACNGRLKSEYLHFICQPNNPNIICEQIQYGIAIIYRLRQSSPLKP